MKGPHGYKRVKGLCLCHNEEHRFRIVFKTVHRQKFEVVGKDKWAPSGGVLIEVKEEESGGRG